MTVIKSEYATILRTKKIVYMPSCLVVEMMIKLYSQVSMINLSGNIHSVVPDLLVLLRRLNLNLRCTAEAFEQSRIKFFIGDWRDDKLRARKLFFNLMSRLGYLSELVGAVEKKLLYDAIEEMGRDWNVLDKVMEKKCDEDKFHRNCGTCRYFRSVHPGNWCQIMANILISLGDRDEYDEPGTYLMLLCYNRIKFLLMKEISEIEAKTRAVKKFNPNRILCVSDEEFPITCPSCMKMTECASTNSCAPPKTKKPIDRPVRPISLKQRVKPAVDAMPRGLLSSGLASFIHGKK